MMTYGFSRAEFANESMISLGVSLSPAAANMGSAELKAKTKCHSHPHSFSIQAETAIRDGESIHPGSGMGERSRREDGLVPS